MRIKVKPWIIFGAITALLIVALGLFAELWGKFSYGGLLLAQPLEYNAPGFNLEQLEDFCNSEFILTYKIHRHATAGAEQEGVAVTLIGTNSYYGQINPFIIKQGAFFTAQAFKARHKQVVLNETAAWQIFGSNNICGHTVKIDGKSWLIVGVLQDNYGDEAVIYAPASVTGGQPATLLMPLIEQSFKQNYMQNALKQLGIYKTNYQLINLSAPATLFKQCLGILRRLIIIILLVLLLLRLMPIITCRFNHYRAELQYRYGLEILLSEPINIIKTLLPAACILLGLPMLLALALQVLSLCLNMADTWPDFISALQIFIGGKTWHI